MEEKFKKNYSMQTVHKAIHLLKAFSIEQRMLSMTELHHITGLSKSSLQRILSTLVFEGFLQKNEETKKYQLGLELLFLGKLVEMNSNLLSIAQPIMEEIRYKTGESVSLSVIENQKRKCIGNLKCEFELQTKTFVGQESPLYAGASAKVLLAYFSEQQLEQFLQENELTALTENTITSKETLKQELKRIREQGYAISCGERLKGTFSISAPVFSPFHEVLGGLSLVIPTPRVEEYDLDLLIALIKEGAGQVSRKMKC